MSGLIIRNFTGATSVNYHNGVPYDVDGALLVSQGMCIAQSYAGWTRSSLNSTVTTPADNAYVTIATVTVPAGTMGANSKLVIVTDYDYTNSASTKTLAVDWGGSNISGPTFTTTGAVKIILEIINKNSRSSQIILNNNSYGTDTVAHLTASKDTASDVAIDFKVKWSAAALTETITLLGYSIWHYPGS